jgi:hypothetical protein
MLLSYHLRTGPDRGARVIAHRTATEVWIPQDPDTAIRYRLGRLPGPGLVAMVRDAAHAYPMGAVLLGGAHHGRRVRVPWSSLIFGLQARAGSRSLPRARTRYMYVGHRDLDLGLFMTTNLVREHLPRARS